MAEITVNKTVRYPDLDQKTFYFDGNANFKLTEFKSYTIPLYFKKIGTNKTSTLF